MDKNHWLLYTGDAIAIAVLTVIGFATHEQLDVSFIPRMTASFFPLLISWLVIAPWFGLFQDDFPAKLRPSWRVALAALYASTMAAFLRGLILRSDIPPVFILALGGSAALGMVVWRGFYSRWVRGRS